MEKLWKRQLPWECTVCLSQRFQHSLAFVVGFLREFVWAGDILALPLPHRFRANQMSNAQWIFAQQFQWLWWSSVAPEQFVGIYFRIQEVCIVWSLDFAQFNCANRCRTAAIPTIRFFLWRRIDCLPSTVRFTAQRQIRTIHPQFIPHVIIPNRIRIQFVQYFAVVINKIVDGKWCLRIVCTRIRCNDASRNSNGTCNCRTNISV